MSYPGFCKINANDAVKKGPLQLTHEQATLYKVKL